MKSAIVFIIPLIFLLGIISALELNCYSGESYTFDIGTSEKIYWTVVPEDTNLTGLNITHEGTNIILEFSPLYISDSFTLIFFEEKTKEVVKEVSVGGGGGTRTIYKDRNITKYIEKEVPIEGECEDCPEQEIEEPTQKRVLIWVVFGVFLIIYLYLILKKRNIELKGGVK